MEIEFNGLKRISRKFWIPRFTISAYEHSLTREGFSHSIDIIKFDDKVGHFPSEVSGIVFKKDLEAIKVKWNEYGECTIKGKRAKNFDLIRDDRVVKEINVQQNLFLGCLGILIVLIYMALKS